MAAAILAGLLALAAPAGAAAPGPVTVEYYYRVRWGQMGAFRRLYDRNHAPVLKEMQRQGWIRAIRTEAPFNHMAGPGRWDLRVTITYRDAEAALGPGYEAAAAKTMDRLYPDAAAHSREEAERMGLLDEHWDVIVAEAG